MFRMMVILFIPFLFCYLQAKVPMEYLLINTITFPTVSATRVISSNLLFSCSLEKLDIFSLNTGTHIDLIDFSQVAPGSNLICLDVYENNTFCLFSKGTFLIRYNVQLKTHLSHDLSSSGNTAGKLMLGGEFAIVNAPSSARIYIVNFMTMASMNDKPLSSASTASYSFEVNTKGNQVAVYVSKYMYIYTYSEMISSWTLVYNTTLTPIIGSSIFWISYSPAGDVFYNTRGNRIIQIRSTADYSVISERSYSMYTGISVSNLQFTNTIGDLMSIQLYNSTQNKSFLQILNVTSNTSEYKDISDGKNMSFQSIKVYPTERVMILFYGITGCEVYELRCPEGSVYSSAEGLCLYCNETNLCTQNGSTTLNQTSNVTATNTTTNSSTTNKTNTTDLTSINLNNTSITNNTNTIIVNGTNNTMENATANITNTQNNTTVNTTNNTTDTQDTNATLINIVNQTAKIFQFTPFQEEAIKISGRFYSLPTIRQSFKSFSYLFLAIDGLWMYQYHNRTYGDLVQNIFESVRRIQDMKFTFFTFIGNAYELLTDTQTQIQNISQYLPYTNTNYVEVENKDGSFLSNSVDFILFHIPGTCFTLLLFRWLFFRIKHCKFASFLKLYKFWGYLIVCLLEPNVEYFSYLLGNHFHLSFYFSYLNKIFAVIWISCLFLIILFSLSLLFFLKYLYGKKVQCFMDNTVNKFWGITWIVFALVIKRMFTGMSHSYLYEYPTEQLLCLILAELTQLSVMFILWKKLKLFPENLGVWARLFMNLIMISFQCCLLVKNYVKDLEIVGLIDDSIYEIITALFGSSFIFCLLSMISTCIESVIKKKKSKQLNKKVKTFKSSKSCKEKLDQAKPQTVYTVKTTPSISVNDMLKRNIISKIKTKFIISSKAITEKQEEEDNRSAICEQILPQSNHHEDILKEEQFRSQIGTSKKFKTNVSIKNNVQRKVPFHYFTQHNSQLNFNSGVSIEYELIDEIDKQPTFLSFKKIKTTQFLTNNKIKRNFNNNISINSGMSKTQIDEVIFESQIKPPTLHKIRTQPEQNFQLSKSHGRQDTERSIKSIKKSLKKIKSTKNINSNKQILTTQTSKPSKI